jgi:RNA ligase (TIGR02306 family)
MIYIGIDPGKGYPKSLRGWFWYILAKLYIYRPAVYGADQCKAPKQFAPVYDVEGFKNYPRTFAEGEEVIVTEKIHGSNARYQFGSTTQKMHVGSHNYWKSEKSTCIWRRALAQHPWLSEFCTQHPDHTVYLEVVPTQKGYTYGCTGDETKVFVFDVLKPDGTWVNKIDLYGMDPLGLGQHLVPLLNGHCKAFSLDEIKTLVEGPSTVPGAKHIREGIVISSATERTIRGLGRAQLKLKSNAFLAKEVA